MLGELCIWCGDRTIDSDLSHVVPECFGNDREHYLKSGIVCRRCNNYFGTKVEPALIADPLIHAICVATRIVDPGDANVFRDRMFEHPHQPVEPVKRDLNLHAKYATDHFYADISYSVTGRVRLEYNYRREARFSRALHKMAFENYVWHILSGRLPCDSPDPFSDRFYAIKQWVRFGQPHRSIRPYIRMPATNLERNWLFMVLEYKGEMRTEMRLYGDCFTVSLTTDRTSTTEHLRESYANPMNNAVLVERAYEVISSHA